MQQQSEEEEKELSSIVESNGRLVLRHLKGQQLQQFIDQLVSEYRLQLPVELATVDGAGLLSFTNKLWAEVQSKLRATFGVQFGPVFVSALRWPGVECHVLADKLDKDRKFAYSRMETKLRHIEAVSRDLGAQLTASSVHAAATNARQSPLDAPTERDLSRCSSATDLVLLLVRCDRLRCLEPLCAGRQPLEELLSRLLLLVEDFAAEPLPEHAGPA